MQQHEEEPWQETEGNGGQQKRRGEQVPKNTGVLSLEALQLYISCNHANHAIRTINNQYNQYNQYCNILQQRFVLYVTLSCNFIFLVNVRFIIINFSALCLLRRHK